MSVEALVITALVEDGSVKPAFVKGITKNDFEIYEDEFTWLEQRYERRKPITRRVFRERFSDFDYVVPQENLDDLLDELKLEKAYSKVYSLIESASDSLLPENAIDTAEHMREVLADVIKSYSPHSDISVKDWKDHFEQVRHNRILAKRGQTIGMPLLIPSLDYHWDGLVPSRLIGILARPGEGKSYLIAWIAWVAIKLGYRIGLFSPEMNKFEHINRLHTLASADPDIQREVGLKQSFRNRDLMRGTAFNIKQYKKFCEYFESLPGSCEIFTKQYRKSAMTPQYIASRVEDLGLHGVLVDPISKIQTLKRKDNPVWEAYDKVGSIQELAEELNVFAVATNWSNRQTSKKNQAPDLDDSFGSDALAQEADHMIGLKHDPESHTLEMRCSKSRFGVNKFRIDIEFLPNTGYWSEKNINADIVAYAAAQNGNFKNGNSKEKLHDVVSAEVAHHHVKKAAKAAQTNGKIDVRGIRKAAKSKKHKGLVKKKVVA